MKFFLDIRTAPLVSATVIARGEMRQDEAEYLLKQCAELPAEVRELLVYLDGLAVVDPRALRTVVHGMRDWMDERQGRAEFIASRERLSYAVRANGPVAIPEPMAALAML